VFLPRSSTETDRGEPLVDEHRGRFGVEPICKTLGVSVSAYYERRSCRRSARGVEDERLLARIRELHGFAEVDRSSARSSLWEC
jgi:hypothetical protein